MLDMFCGLQIFMWTVFVVIVLGKLISFVGAEPHLKATLNTKENDDHVPLSDSMPDGHGSSGTSAQIRATLNTKENDDHVPLSDSMPDGHGSSGTSAQIRATLNTKENDDHVPLSDSMPDGHGSPGTSAQIRATLNTKENDDHVPLSDSMPDGHGSSGTSAQIRATLNTKENDDHVPLSDSMPDGHGSSGTSAQIRETLNTKENDDHVPLSDSMPDGHGSSGTSAQIRETLNTKENDDHVPLSDSMPDGHGSPGTSAQIRGIQDLGSSCDKCAHENLFPNKEVINTNSRAQLLNEGREIRESSKLLFREQRSNTAASQPKLTGNNTYLSNVTGKYRRKSRRVTGFTAHMRADTRSLSSPGINRRISGTSEDHILLSDYTYGKNLSNFLRVTKRDANGLKNSQIINTAIECDNNNTADHNEHSDSNSSLEYAARNIIDETADSDMMSTFVAGVSRPKRQVPSAVAQTTSNRNIRAREEGDVIIGAMFPLHMQPVMNNTYTRQCGAIWETYGIQRVEAFLMTVDSINRNSSILPHIKLGWDIRDSCWYSPIALENSIDFIKDAIASQSNINNVYPSVPSATSAPPGPSGKLITTSSETVSTQMPRGSDSTASCRSNKNLKPIIGLVGPGSSESTIQCEQRGLSKVFTKDLKSIPIFDVAILRIYAVQNLLQIFNIPQIGYSATSHDLSNKNHYRYFLRVVPPDSYQAQALVDILLKCNWTYVSTIHTDGNYGLKGITEFTDLAKAKGICIAVSDGVSSSALDDEFDDILAKLLEDQNASVVVCFCEGATVRNLFRAMKRRHMERRLLIIGSDGWGNRMDVVTDLEPEIAGAISIMFHSPPFKDFKPHYEKLKPHKNPKNPWFSEFWEVRFNCSLDKNNTRKYMKLCSGNESLAGSDEDSKLGFVVNAVMAMAVALQDMHQDLCPESEGLCQAMQPVDGSVYLQYLQNVSFQSHSGEEIHFDKAGDPSANIRARSTITDSWSLLVSDVVVPIYNYGCRFEDTASVYDASRLG